MRILNVTRIEYFFIDTDEEEWSSYRRNVDGGEDDWERLMGDSWEPYYQAYELENVFQQWLKSNLA